MTERIVDFGNDGKSAVRIAMARQHGAVVRGEIVRCRDCANFDSKRDGCWWFAHAERQSDYSWADEPSDVEPGGFCAWGERKEVRYD